MIASVPLTDESILGIYGETKTGSYDKLANSMVSGVHSNPITVRWSTRQIWSKKQRVRDVLRRVPESSQINQAVDEFIPQSRL